VVIIIIIIIFFFCLTLFHIATVFLLCTYRQRTTVARYGFPNTTLQLERIDLAGGRGVVVETRVRERESEKMVTLTILLHPPEKSRVGRVRIIIKYYCQHHRRRRGKKTLCRVCVCCIIHESCAVRSPNRKFKTKKCKKFFYYTTRASRPFYCSRISNSGKLWSRVWLCLTSRSHGPR